MSTVRVALTQMACSEDAAANLSRQVALVERAAAANIPVTVFDSGLDSTQYVSYVATDNVEAGRLAARTLIELIGGGFSPNTSMTARASVRSLAGVPVPWAQM